MDANERPKARLFRVGKRVYRKTCKGDRRRRPTYTYPEVRFSNGWLRDAGFRPGDRVAVGVLDRRQLVVVRVGGCGAPKATKASEPAAPQLPITVRL